jgi:hypothetical protein
MNEHLRPNSGKIDFGSFHLNEALVTCARAAITGNHMQGSLTWSCCLIAFLRIFTKRHVPDGET